MGVLSLAAGQPPMAVSHAIEAHRASQLLQEQHPLVLDARFSGGYVAGSTSRSQIGLRVAHPPEIFYRNLDSGMRVTVLIEAKQMHITVLPLGQGRPDTSALERVGTNLRALLRADGTLDSLEKLYSKLNFLKEKGVPQSDMEMLLAAELSMHEPVLYKATSAI
jgi:hypothetical protein